MLFCAFREDNTPLEGEISAQKTATTLRGTDTITASEHATIKGEISNTILPRKPLLVRDDPSRERATTQWKRPNYRLGAHDHEGGKTQTRFGHKTTSISKP